MFMTIEKSHADQLGVLSATLPGQIGLWSAEPGDRMYDSDSIFSYIDGAGEVYRAYNMRSCLSRRYTSADGPAIVLDIFDMGTSEDAFGVFTHDQDGRAVDVGQGGLYRPGWLSFWKGRFFASIYAEEETEASKEAIMELSRVVASLIKDGGLEPEILLKLPLEGLQSRSIRYLHQHTLLNYHFYLADDNILNLGQQTNAVLAGYRRSGKGARLLLVSYPNEGKAGEAYKSLIYHYLPEVKSTEAVQLEDGKWSAAGLKNRFLTVVLEADTQPLAEGLLQQIQENL